MHNPLEEQIGGSHYKGYNIQPVEFIESNSLTFLSGCAIKRLLRHKDKNGAEDISKAIHEMRLLIKLQNEKKIPVYDFITENNLNVLEGDAVQLIFDGDYEEAIEVMLKVHDFYYGESESTQEELDQSWDAFEKHQKEIEENGKDMAQYYMGVDMFNDKIASYEILSELLNYSPEYEKVKEHAAENLPLQLDPERVIEIMYKDKPLQIKVDAIVDMLNILES